MLSIVNDVRWACRLINCNVHTVNKRIVVLNILDNTFPTTRHLSIKEPHFNDCVVNLFDFIIVIFAVTYLAYLFILNLFPLILQTEMGIISISDSPLICNWKTSIWDSFELDRKSKTLKSNLSLSL